MCTRWLRQSTGYRYTWFSVFGVWNTWALCEDSRRNSLRSVKYDRPGTWTLRESGRNWRQLATVKRNTRKSKDSHSRVNDHTGWFTPGVHWSTLGASSMSTPINVTWSSARDRFPDPAVPCSSYGQVLPATVNVFGCDPSNDFGKTVMKRRHLMVQGHGSITKHVFRHAMASTCGMTNKKDCTWQLP